MANEFYTILTEVGRAKVARAISNRASLELVAMAVGDGRDGAYCEPDPEQRALCHEVWRGPINDLTPVPDNPNWVVAELVIPDDAGGWYVREVAAIDADGDVIAVGKYPESYKPLMAGGSNKQLYIRMVLEVTNASAVTLKVDPAVVLATRQYVDGKVAAATEGQNASLHDYQKFCAEHYAPLASPGFTGAPAAPTPERFDSSTRLATTEAMRQALGSFNGVAWYSAVSGVVLTSDDIGRVIVAGASESTQVWTPPVMSELPNGASMRIQNLSGHPLILVQRQTEDRYMSAVDASNTAKVFGVASGTEVTLVKYSDTTWLVGGTGAANIDLGRHDFYTTLNAGTAQTLYSPNINVVRGVYLVTPYYCHLGVTPGGDSYYFHIRTEFVAGGGHSGFTNQPYNAPHSYNWPPFLLRVSSPSATIRCSASFNGNTNSAGLLTNYADHRGNFAFYANRIA